jgi:hypothetical protein
MDHEPHSQSLHAPATGLGAFVRHEWPYIAMLALAVLGVALASVAQGVMTVYWEFLTPLFAAVCVYARMRDAQRQAAFGRLVRIEVLHWGAVFLAMQIIYVTSASRMMGADALGLVIMTILALGTFTAGAQIGSWRISLVGAVLGVGVPFVAWLERAALLINLVVVAGVALLAYVLLHRRHGPPGGR